MSVISLWPQVHLRMTASLCPTHCLFQIERIHAYTRRPIALECSALSVPPRDDMLRQAIVWPLIRLSWPALFVRTASVTLFCRMMFNRGQG